jgi:hypothetical protein
MEKIEKKEVLRTHAGRITAHYKISLANIRQDSLCLPVHQVNLKSCRRFISVQPTHDCWQRPLPGSVLYRQAALRKR